MTLEFDRFVIVYRWVPQIPRRSGQKTGLLDQIFFKILSKCQDVALISKNILYLNMVSFFCDVHLVVLEIRFFFKTHSHMLKMEINWIVVIFFVSQLKWKPGNFWCLYTSQLNGIIELCISESKMSENNQFSRFQSPYWDMSIFCCNNFFQIIFQRPAMGTWFPTGNQLPFIPFSNNFLNASIHTMVLLTIEFSWM